MVDDSFSVTEGGDALIVLITASSREEADRIARRLIGARLAACVNIALPVKSLFMWEGTLAQADEALLVVKSRRARFRELVETVKALHSYSVPEIIALPISIGSADYLRWLSDSTS